MTLVRVGCMVDKARQRNVAKQRAKDFKRIGSVVNEQHRS